jgi:predicted transcriptional regulator
MTHITTRLDAATEARLRQAAEELDRRVEDLAELAIAEAAAAYYARRTDDPAIGMGVLHPILFPAELHV